MSARDTSVNHFLEPLRPFLSDKAITEIVVNRPGQVYFETRAGWKAKDVPQLTYEHLIKLGVAVAKFAGENVLFQSTVPILSAVLPGGERAQFVMPPACRADTVSLTIRKPSFDVRTLDTYISDGFFATSTFTTCRRPTNGEQSFFNAALSLAKTWSLPAKREAVRRPS